MGKTSLRNPLLFHKLVAQDRVDWGYLHNVFVLPVLNNEAHFRSEIVGRTVQVSPFFFCVRIPEDLNWGVSVSSRPT